MTLEMFLPFDTDNADFARGFVAGSIWTLMTENPDKLTGLIFHAENVEMILQLIEMKGASFKPKFSDDEQWMRLE